MAKPKGRFAPSPTGELHFGSLVCALASYLDVKSLDGHWQLRFEDTDFERTHAHFSQSILDDLHALGLFADSVVYQSARIADYLTKLGNFIGFFCSCSRKFLAQGGICYCHVHSAPFCLTKYQRAPQNFRLHLPNRRIAINEDGQSVCAPMLSAPVVLRQNGVINYLFSCAIDDVSFGMTHITRGQDLYHMAGAQAWIGRQICQDYYPHYRHLTLICDKDGRKLSKQNHAPAIGARTLNQDDKRILLLQALNSLQAPNPHFALIDFSNIDFADILPYACTHWQTTAKCH